MGAVPRSLRFFVRDVVVLLVVAFAVGCPLLAWATHVDTLSWWRYGLAEFEDSKQRLVALGAPPELITPPTLPPLDWGSVAKTAGGWIGGLALWVAACWVATRARAGLRTVWVPGTVAAVLVVARSVGALVPNAPVAPLLLYPELWPGPATPGTLADDGSYTLLAWHPAWAYPPLVLGLLLAAAWLGARAGRLPDDRASRHVAPTTRAGRVLATVVVGMPVLVGVAGAIVGYLMGTRDAGFATTHSFVLELVAPLVTVVLAAALLSGTGPLGGTVTVLAIAPLVVGPVTAWAALQSSELAFAEAAGVAVLCAAVALWRPAALWGSEILGPARRPAEAPDWSAPTSPAGPSGRAVVTWPGPPDSPTDQ